MILEKKMNSFSFLKLSTTFELDANIANVVYYGKTLLALLSD